MDPEGTSMSADFHPTQIDLAREPPFRLGRVEVRPATREVISGHRREVLEPRVMQVLTRLAIRRGEVVSRDELVAACWAGRIVGEDAIQRCISRLRQLGRALGGFEIETVARVGYRLSETVRQGRRGSRLRLALAGVAALALVGGAVGWMLSRSVRGEAQDTPRVSVQAFKLVAGDPQAAAFAASVSDELAAVLNKNAILTTSGAAGAAGDLNLGGTVYQEGERLRVRVQLDDPKAKLTLWSGEFERPASAAPALRQMVAGAAGEAIYSAFEPRRQDGLTIDPAAVALFIEGESSFKDPKLLQSGEPLRIFQQVVAKAPNFAAGRGTYALALHGASRSAPPEEAAELERRARTEAEQAIRLSPSRAGGAYDALFMMRLQSDPTNLAAAEDQLLKAIATDPEFPFNSMRECRFLLEVGRAQASLRHCERATALRPLAEPIGWTYAAALYFAGQEDLARAQLSRVTPFHPDHLATRFANFDIDAFSGSADRALAILADPDQTPPFSRQGAEALRLMLKARKSRSPRDVAAAIERLQRAVRARQLSPRYFALGAMALGRLDEAFDGLRMDHEGMFFPERLDLFAPVAAPIWKDPRFWRLAEQRGLVRYWRTRRIWPDFCSDPAVGVDCDKAARAAGV
jgi:DNA-binding winged helix-turn-helix (wHTH) protein/TolB-like protein